MKIARTSSTLSDQDQGHGMTLKFFSIYHNTNCQACISALAQGRKLLLSMFVHLILINKCYEYRHARMCLEPLRTFQCRYHDDIWMML